MWSLQLMDTLIKTDIAIATHVAMYGGSKKDALRLRRRSVPLTRKKSSMSYLSARSENETAVPTDVRSPLQKKKENIKKKKNEKERLHDSAKSSSFNPEPQPPQPQLLSPLLLPPPLTIFYIFFVLFFISLFYSFFFVFFFPFGVRWASLVTETVFSLILP